jgi:hypothetical protein
MDHAHFMELFQNNRIFHRNSIVHELFNSTIHVSNITKYRHMWHTIDKIIDAMLAESTMVNSLSPTVLLVETKHVLPERTIHRLLIIKWQLRVTHSQFNECQNPRPPVAMLAHALWMLVGLWHELQDSAFQLLTCFQETILIHQFRTVMTCIITNEIQQQNGRSNNQQRLIVLRDRLFSIPGQSLEKTANPMDCFKWKAAITQAPPRRRNQAAVTGILGRNPSPPRNIQTRKHRKTQNLHANFQPIDMRQANVAAERSRKKAENAGANPAQVGIACAKALAQYAAQAPPRKNKRNKHADTSSNDDEPNLNKANTMVAWNSLMNN